MVLNKKKSTKNKSTKVKSTKVKSTKNKSTKVKSTKNKSTKNKSTKNKSTKNKSNKNKSPTNKSTKNKSTKNKSTKNKSPTNLDKYIGKVILVKLPNNKMRRWRWITKKNEKGRYYARNPKIGVLINELKLKREKDYSKETILPKNTITN